MAKLGWSRDWTVGVRVWVDRNGETVLGQGRAELLEAIGQRRSITAAAKAVGMSYRKAWMLVQEVNQAAGQPLVEAAVGGLQGGGARLTERGRLAVDVYRQLDRALTERAGRVLSQLIAPHVGEDAACCLHVAAAISFQEALGQILSAFALHRPLVRVRAVYGASNELAAHLLAGAPGDVFISAECQEIGQLKAAGRLAPASRRIVALNGLAVIGPAGGASINNLRELAAGAHKIAVAEPACPLGRYSKTYLEAAGAYDRLLPKLLQVDNSRAVLSAVASGSADAGLAFTSDAVGARECAILFRVPRSKAAAEYVAAVLAGNGNDDQARELLDFLSSPTALRCLRRCGFRPPPATKPRTKVR